VGWIVLAILLAVSSALNAYQVVSVEDSRTQVARGVLSLTLAVFAGLSLRKGLAERSRDLEDTPGAMAAARATRRGLIPVVALIILILSAVGVGIATRGPNISMPDALSGNLRLHGRAIDQIEEGVEEAIGSGTVVGLYGTSGRPRFAVMATDSVPPPGEDPLSDFVRGLGQPQDGAAVSIDTSSRTTRQIGSVRYSCAPYSVSTDAGSLSTTVCDWNDGESYGLILGYDPGLDVFDLAPEAYEAVVD
jgi:hypothetical protein